MGDADRLELTIQTEMSPDGGRLLQVTADGMVRVFDLELRRMIASRSFAPHTRATWIAEGKLLVTHTKTQPQILEPVTGDVEALKLEPIAMAQATLAGDRVIVSNRRRRRRRSSTSRRAR